MQRQQGDEFEAGVRRRSSTIVDVLNDSGGDLDEFAVVRLASAAITYDDNAAEFKYQPAANVDAPGAATDQDVVGVLLDPLTEGAIGRATILGLTPVKIYVGTLESAWKWADVSSGVTDHLVMKQYGGCARVIWKQSGTGGEKWALVCLQERNNWREDAKLLPDYNASVVQFLYHDDAGIIGWFDAEECS